MQDTSPEIEKIFREKIIALSPQERVLMGISMFETAREIVLSSLPKDLSVTERNVKFFLRFYENDFDKETLEKVIAWIRKS